MWANLPQVQKDEYKKMILAFASLTEMFAQKAEANNDDVVLPIINSKYQETVFQRVFHAFAEDIGNTSYDASLQSQDEDGTNHRYLVGIKTFGYRSEAQKVAQFKANHNDWAEIINRIQENAQHRSKTEINEINKDLYKELAVKIATIRNMRIASSQANIQGFSITNEDSNVTPIYHVLMPAKDDNAPYIYVGETSYDCIDIENINIGGCTNKRTPTNFVFDDGNHRYRFTSADSQLLMYFNNTEIVRECWQVKYADDAYEIFSEIANRVFSQESNKTIESYSWKINVEKHSGFNAFYGVGSKLATGDRAPRINALIKKFEGVINQDSLERVRDLLTQFLITSPSGEKENIRAQILNIIEILDNNVFSDEVRKLVFRPKEEIYIPIYKSREFHCAHPDFFAEGAGNMVKNEYNKWVLTTPKENRRFPLILEPSGEEIECFITQDVGKAIESTGSQSILGEWLLRRLFLLDEYEPLTQRRLDELELNGMRLSKTSDGKIHLNFIWIDDNNLPEDYIE